MTVSVSRFDVRLEQGFEIYVLSNENVQVELVPELGARIISLKNLRTGREWLWHPVSGLKLFRNRPFDDFSKSPLIGLDECFPTIAPCWWNGRSLLDHGELWRVPWDLDSQRGKLGILTMRAQLSGVPFEFSRTVQLRHNELNLSYRLVNHSNLEQLYLWAMHPLLQLQAGDKLQLPPSTRELLRGVSWLDAVDTAIPAGDCEKVFASPLKEGFAAIRNPQTGDSLAFQWDPAQNNTLGLWLTRGGWNGHHHFALEPTNSSGDALTQSAQDSHCGRIAGCGSLDWQVCLRIGP